ncbi:unnamed protein product [Timema podura]|uniref:Uncharacterized protein n=1 Tax=Timema podura TaxID=61482 RepID=A0ABN7NW04_TIMPD|nr:unnamed protein product [Timema podura]
MSNNSSKEEITPRTRTRSSSSATEGSKPISVTQRRQTTAGMIGGRPVTYTQAEDPGKSTGVLARRVLMSHPGDNTTTTDSGHFPGT